MCSFAAKIANTEIHILTVSHSRVNGSINHYNVNYYIHQMLYNIYLWTTTNNQKNKLMGKYTINRLKEENGLNN